MAAWRAGAPNQGSKGQPLAPHLAAVDKMLLLSRAIHMLHSKCSVHMCRLRQVK